MDEIIRRHAQRGSKLADVGKADGLSPLSACDGDARQARSFAEFELAQVFGLSPGAQVGDGYPACSLSHNKLPIPVTGGCAATRHVVMRSRSELFSQSSHGISTVASTYHQWYSLIDNHTSVMYHLSYRDHHIRRSEMGGVSR